MSSLLAENTLPKPIEGFDLVDRLLERARKQSMARAKEELLNVGRVCEEILIALAQALYRPAIHEPRQGAKPGASPIRRLAAYIDSELPGSINAPTRTLAKSSLETAESLQQLGTDNVKTAALCVHATTSLVNILRTQAGQDEMKHTVADLCERYLESQKVVGTHRYVLEMLSRMDIGKKIANQLTAEDLIAHCGLRREKVSAATINQDVVYLRGVFTTAKDVWNMPISLDAFEEAKRWLHRLDLVSKSTRRTRRPDGNELQILLDHFGQLERDGRTKIPMTDIIKFALYTGLRIGRICELTWSDIEEKKEQFIAPALAIIEKHRKFKVSDRVFPYLSTTVSANYTTAKRQREIKNLRFNDLRREAVIRLYYEEGKSVDEIAETIGRLDLNSVRRDIVEAAADYK